MRHTDNPNKETKMTYAFDDGSSSSTDSVSGPFVNWHARETRDGAISGRSFSIRDEDGERTDITSTFKKGVIFDLESLVTGWCWADGSVGQAPLWEFNESPARFNPQPEDRGTESWKKGFQIRLGLSKTESALWSQAGAGAFQGLKNLMGAVNADGNGGKGEGLCVVAAMTDVDEITYKKGGTSAPIFTIKKWAPRPECLKEQTVVAAIVEEDVESRTFASEEFVDEF